MITLQHIPPAFVCRAWPDVSDMLRRGLEHAGDEYTMDQLKMMLVRGEHALLVYEDDGDPIGAATLSIEDYPNARIGVVTCVGGEALATDDNVELLHDWCRRAGCTLTRGHVRESVARLLRKFDYTQRYITVEHAL